MSRSSSDDDWILIVIGAVVLTIAGIIWKFSTTFGLDVNTGTSVFFRLVAWAVTVGVSLKFSDDFDPIRFGKIWPILLALLWVCWWPAVDYWAMKELPAFLSEDLTPWWGRWYAKWGGFAAIIAIGYFIKKYFGDD